VVGGAAIIPGPTAHIPFVRRWRPLAALRLVFRGDFLGAMAIAEETPRPRLTVPPPLDVLVLVAGRDPGVALDTDSFASTWQRANRTRSHRRGNLGIACRVQQSSSRRIGDSPMMTDEGRTVTNILKIVHSHLNVSRCSPDPRNG
jgi:hypothetical protein